METKTAAVTVRLDQPLKDRLTAAAQRLDLSENYIVRHAVRAAVNAIEANDYKIELPLEMTLKKVPLESRVPSAVKRTRISSGTVLHGANEPEDRYESRKKRKEG